MQALFLLFFKNLSFFLPGTEMRRFVCCFPLKSPVALTENGNSGTVFADSVDVHGVAADHEVLMDHRFVDTQGTALFQSLVLEPGGRGRIILLFEKN